jgi:hypothetical protein
MEDTLNLIRIVKRARPDVQVLIVSSAFRETLRTLMAVYHKRLRCVSKIKPEVRPRRWFCLLSVDCRFIYVEPM